MKYIIAALWLAGALVFRNSVLPRQLFGYGGSILAFVHVCALGLGLLGRDNRPVEQGPPVGGFLVGIAVGLILGIACGGLVSRNPLLYWAAQAITAGFLIFMPLVRL